MNEDYLPNAGFTTPRAAAGIVIAALILLILIKRGFHGVSGFGVSVGIK
jgi:hypothetical protein